MSKKCLRASYTNEEWAYIVANYKTMNVHDIAEHLNKNYKAVHMYIRRMQKQGKLDDVPLPKRAVIKRRTKAEIKRDLQRVMQEEQQQVELYKKNKQARYKRIAYLQDNCVECTAKCKTCPIRRELDVLIAYGNKEKRKGDPSDDFKPGVQGAYIEILPIKFVVEIYENRNMSKREKVEALIGNMPAEKGMKRIESYIETYLEATNKTADGNGLTNKKKKALDEQALVTYYKNNGITATVRQFETSQTRVYMILEENGIKLNRKRSCVRVFTDEEEQEIIELYKTMSILDIIARFSCGVKKIYQVLKKHNVQRRKPGKSIALEQKRAK